MKIKMSLAVDLFFCLAYFFSGFYLLGFSWKSTVVIIGAFVLATVIQSTLHELGHLIGGLISSHSFFSLLFLFFDIKRGENGKLRTEISKLGFQCLMIPRKDRFVFYNLGGLFFNFACLTAATVYTIFAPEVSAFALASIAASFTKILVNGIPTFSGAIPNDGMIVRMLCKSKVERYNYFRYMRAYPDYVGSKPIVLEESKEYDSGFFYGCLTELVQDHA